MTALKFVVLACALALAGCLGSVPRDGVAVLPPEKPRLDQPDSASMKRCANPVKLPAGGITQEQGETYWGMDTDALIECGRRHQILIRFINRRDGGLAGR